MARMEMDNNLKKLANLFKFFGLFFRDITNNLLQLALPQTNHSNIFLPVL